MIDRYTPEDFKQLWSEENKFRIWSDISLEWIQAHTEEDVPTPTPDLFKIELLEQTTHHDVVAFLMWLEEELPPHLGQFVHRGLTSTDIVDTANSVLLREACDLILERAQKLKKALFEKVLETKKTIILGRTHGQTANKMSLGHFFLSHYLELKRNISRVINSQFRIGVIKLSGPVGNNLNNRTDAAATVAKKLTGKLHFDSREVSTQVVPRDRHAELILSLSLLAASLERLATDLRLMSQSGAGVLSEGFSGGQKGSSAMPHKRNPILCENICGLARFVRSQSIVALENVPLWNQRDISHSSNERIMFSQVTSVMGFMVERMTKVIQNLVIHGESFDDRGFHMSETVLTKLMDAGWGRTRAHQKVQSICSFAEHHNLSFLTAIVHDDEAFKAFGEDSAKLALLNDEIEAKILADIEEKIKEFLV